MTPTIRSALVHPGVAAALAAAALFGAGTPMAKQLLGTVNRWLLAGLLHLGSGAGLALWRLLSRAAPVKLPVDQRAWRAAAVLAGGVLGPLLLVFGLSRMPASGASLLLNAEGVFTALLAWFVFKENVDRRIALGMLAIVAGALVWSWPGEAHIGAAWPALAVLGACAAWAVDNNLTRKVALADATWTALIKGSDLVRRGAAAPRHRSHGRVLLGGPILRGRARGRLARRPGHAGPAPRWQTPTIAARNHTDSMA